MNNLFCPWDPAIYLVFSSSAPSLLYYAYIPIILMSVFAGLFIFFKSNHSISGKLFLAITLSFSLWVINILVQWSSNNVYIQMFSWQMTALFEILIFIFSVYFHQIFIKGKDISWNLKKILSIILLVVLVLLPTRLNINYFYLTDVDCGGQNGLLWNFIYIIEPILIIFVAYTGFKLGRQERKSSGKFSWITLFTLAVVFALSLFYITNLAGELTKVYEINLWGPIGFLVLIAILAYLIIEFKIFKIKVIASEALVVGLIFLIGSQFFFIKTQTNFILNGVTFIGIIIFGYMLIKGVKREIKQKERLQSLSVELEKSNSDLEIANEKLKGLDQLKSEFVSLASHQLRSPLTAIRGYTSMLMDGDYGEITNSEAKGALGKINESSINLSKIVEDLLNVTKIEQGGMKYVMAPFNLAQLTKDVVGELSVIAKNKKLEMTFNADNDSLCQVNGDKEKIRQVIINFVDNSIKYTKEGSVQVSVKREQDKVIFKIVDTGVGMNQEIKSTLFHKFARGEGARMNTTGTGLGLYLCKEIAEAHGGRVSVESEGPGRGSTFVMELKVI